MYSKTNCAIKINGKITMFFKYAKGVRQGCPLSCLLFNLYINDVISVLNRVGDQNIRLSEDDIINILMYADDLMILAQSQEEL